MKKYKAVIFDLDGTLLNTIDDLGDSVNYMLEQFGYPTFGIEEYKYKLLSKVQRRLGKQIALIKQAKKEINSDGYNYTYGGVKVLRKRLRGLKCAYNLSKDESIKKQIDKLEEIIKIKEGVER